MGRRPSCNGRDAASSGTALEEPSAVARRLWAAREAVRTVLQQFFRPRLLGQQALSLTFVNLDSMK